MFGQGLRDTGELAQYRYRSRSGYKRSLIRYLREAYHGTSEAPHKTTGTDDSSQALTVEGSSDNRTITTRSEHIRTVEDALAYAEVDTEIWKVDRFIVNSWEMGYKDENGEAQTRPLWQVKVWLKRRVPLLAESVTELCLQRIAAKAPVYVKPQYTPTPDPHMLEVSLFDMHFGKLAWARETGQDYDLKIAERIFADAVADILHKARSFDIEQVVLPIGNDFLHIDGLDNSTANKTVQDTDGRLPKIVETGQEALVNAIDLLQQTAPVKVVLVPGNHDLVTIWHIARFLWAYYRNCPNVTVDCEPAWRKCVVYGKSLIGYSHEQLKNLALLMPTEWPQEWAATEWHEWHTGHLHKRSETAFTPVSSNNGVVVRILPSLTATDAWHYGMGFVGGNRIAEAYLWSREHGPTGYLCTSAKDE